VEEAQATAGSVERRHRPRGAVVKRDGMNLPSNLEETDAALVWKRRGKLSEKRGQRI
jgi:hypothetical protein